MKTGYVYIVALNGRALGRLARVKRLCVSLDHPQTRIDHLAESAWRGRRPKLIGYEFVEDLVGARSYIKAALKPFGTGPRGRTFRCPAPVARKALHDAAARQSALRPGRFHPKTGLLIDREIELAGPIAALSRHIADIVEQESRRDLAKIDVFLHPYMIGAIASLFHHRQPVTKIPDEYFPEILREIAWRSWKCRLKPEFFVRLSHRSHDEQKYLELARYRFETNLKTGMRREIPESQMAAFLRQPAQHLRETVATYAHELEHSPKLRLRKALFRLARFALALGAISLGQIMVANGQAEHWLYALVTLFVTGLTILAFNLYETPDLSKGIGFITARELAQELARLRVRSEPRPAGPPRSNNILRVA